MKKAKLTITDKIYLGMLCETLPSWKELRDKYSPNTDLSVFLTGVAFDDSIPKKDYKILKFFQKHSINVVNYFNSLDKDISFEQWLENARRVNDYAKRK